VEAIDKSLVIPNVFCVLATADDGMRLTIGSKHRRWALNIFRHSTTPIVI
jgi:hypothetical protein